jgi:hypothetical protein
MRVTNGNLEIFMPDNLAELLHAMFGKQNNDEEDTRAYNKR